MTDQLNCIEEGELGSSSFINREEELEAKKLIESQLGFEMPRVTGYHIAVKIFVREELVTDMKDDKGNAILGLDGRPLQVAIPETIAAHDKFRKCVALVLNKGPDAYRGERFKNSGPWCRIGDWVIIPRNEGSQVRYRGIPVLYIPDDRVLGIVEDPTHVELY